MLMTGSRIAVQSPHIFHRALSTLSDVVGKSSIHLPIALYMAGLVTAVVQAVPPTPMIAMDPIANSLRDIGPSPALFWPVLDFFFFSSDIYSPPRAALVPVGMR